MARAGLTATIREAREADLPALHHLLAQLVDEAAPAAARERPEEAAAARTWRAILADQRRAILIAESDGGAVIGTADLLVVPNLTHGARPVAYVENVVVDRGHRRRGAGRALMEECERRARTAGCYKLQLLSNERREDAHRFYGSLGFSASTRGYRRYL